MVETISFHSKSSEHYQTLPKVSSNSNGFIGNPNTTIPDQFRLIQLSNPSLKLNSAIDL